MQRLKNYVEKAKERGPTLEPPAALVAWLEEAGDAVLRLPLTMREQGAQLGTLAVEVDDSALGIDLADRVRQACPGGQPCRVWVEGRWKRGTVQVLHFARAVGADEAADFVERER